MPFIHTHALPFIPPFLNPAVPAGIHRSVQSPTPLSVRMDVCLENRLNMYTRVQPVGLMSGLLSEHPAEGVYFQSHIRITLQITRIFWNLYHFSGKWQHVAPVDTDCPGQASVRYCVKGVTLHPNGRVRRRWRSPEFERHSPQSVPDGFLCSPEHSKVCFQPLKIF